MSDAEHLIENVIHAMYENRVDEELDARYNKIMFENTGIKPDDLYQMAQHIVYSLYDGINPFSEEWDRMQARIEYPTWDNPRAGEY